ncbi:MAG: hypothetical protein L3J89_14940 [Gammaproteobacteria bacterium]|nr:hypothetical protein [Gammaproteobacteria bacterium]
MTNGAATTLAYEPNAYRIQKVASAVINNYLLEADNLEALYDENDQLKASYLRGVVILRGQILT